MDPLVAFCGLAGAWLDRPAAAFQILVIVARHARFSAILVIKRSFEFLWEGARPVKHATGRGSHPRTHASEVVLDLLSKGGDGVDPLLLASGQDSWGVMLAKTRCP